MLYFAQQNLENNAIIERLKFVFLPLSCMVPLSHEKNNWNNYPCHPKGEGKVDSVLIGKETGEREVYTPYNTV